MQNNGNLERLTITLPVDMAQLIKGAVEGGDYASTSEVIREALRDWKIKRLVQEQQLAALREDVAKGITDMQAGRFAEFDIQDIIRRGKDAL